MKKIIVLACFVVIILPIAIGTVFSQDLFLQNRNKIDSLNTVLSKTTKPIDRFNILIDISESVGFYAGDPDSVLCIELLQIAQQLKNDSLLAISYDIIGQYISRVKGDNATGLEYFFNISITNLCGSA